MPKQASLRFAEEAGMNTDPIYEADGKISVRKAVPFGLQHVLAMFVANIAPILIVTGVVKVPASEAGAVVQAAMIIAGIGSLLQMYPFFRLGSGLPVIMGISFTFVSVFCVIGLKYGYGAILGAVLIGGVLEGILGLGAAWWRKPSPIPLPSWSRFRVCRMAPTFGWAMRRISSGRASVWPTVSAAATIS